MASRLGDKKTLRIGVMLEEVQFSDIVGIDLFGNLSLEYFNKVKSFGQDISAFDGHAPDTTFYYISSTLEPANTTAGLRFVPNITYDDCPRDLDLVLTGGPLPTHRPPQAERFIKEAFPKTRVWLTTCIGSPWLASAGVLKGKKATTNREFLDFAKMVHPDTEWLDQRWVIEEKEYDGEGKGELWTAGGAGAGIAMIIAYLKQNFDPAYVTKFAVEGIALEEIELNQFYKTEKA
ncbi:dj-1 family protein [Colletotrichum truncatum]|uniref:Dj-1 family protein n=1 Tax=Colletotrichum truncatum TaxID=5467 RepID=A0ACC3YNR6_COLTU|nr:dj-1 family protein [Colletotrichum truncatum]KAF6789443.1 dj-1 family protein [Colletotrichum truncatum]